MRLNRIKETVIYVKDISATKNFYEKLLGLKAMVFVEDKQLFFKIGESMLLFFNPEQSKQKSDVPPHFAYGDQHFAFEVDVDEYAQWKKRLSTDVQIEHEHQWKENFYSFYFRDMENNSVEIVMKGIWDK